MLVCVFAFAGTIDRLETNVCSLVYVECVLIIVARRPAMNIFADGNRGVS